MSRSKRERKTFVETATVENAQSNLDLTWKLEMKGSYWSVDLRSVELQMGQRNSEI